MLYYCVLDYAVLLCTRLCCITVQSSIASEYRSWMIYYSLSVLDGILPNLYYTHYSLLAAAVYVFMGNGGCISHSVIDKAEQYMDRFCEMFSRLYGKHNFNK